MKVLNIRNVPDDTAYAFRVLAAQRGVTYAELLAQLVEQSR